jgi:repressor LexA
VNPTGLASIQPGDPPTERQRELYETMLRYQAENGMPPSLRELLGIKSTNGVTDHLRALQKRGLVKHRPMISRGWIAIRPEQEEP